MRKHIKLIVCILLLIVTVLPAAVFSASAEGGATLTFNLKYDQNKARSMLENINALRKANGQEDVAYDYSLESLAITRAEEIIVSFNHPRPNGSGTVVNVSENIAYGTSFSSVGAGFGAFDNSPPHHNNMIDSRWKGVAVAYAEYGGRYYWVQLFTPNEPTAAQTSAKSGSGTASVRVTGDLIKNTSDPSCDTTPIEIELNGTGKTPSVSVDYTVETLRDDGTTYSITINSKLNPAWTSDAPDVAAVDGTTINALKRGTANLTATVDGKTITVPVTVTGTSIKDAVIELEYTEADFTGSELKPKVSSVKLGDEKLIPYLDYSVQYSDNVEVGTATVTVVGKGEYSGQVVTSFTIKGCAHQYDEGKVTREATCKQEGAKEFTCSECGYVKTETIAKLDHSDADKNNKCDVCGATIAAPTPTTAPSSSGSDDTTGGSSEDDPASDPSEDGTPEESDSTTKKTTKNTGDTDNVGPDTGDHRQDNSAANSIVLGVAILASFMFVAYLIKIVALERRKTDKRRSAIRR